MEKLSKILQSLTQRERHTLLYAVLIVIVGSLALGTLWYIENTEVIPAEGGTYTEGILGQPSIINPILQNGNGVDRDLSALFFTQVEKLIESVKHSDDGRIWTVNLKENLKWSDGEPLNTEDVMYAIDLIQDQKTNSPLLQTWQGVVVERLSDREFRLTLKTPYAFLLDNLNDLRIIPKHIFSAIPSANLKLSAFNLEPVGNGPYRFIRSTKERDGFITEINAEANPYAVDGKPLIKNLRIRFFKNSDELLKNFNRLDVSGFGGIDIKQLENLGVGYMTNNLIAPRYYAIFLNQSLHPALKDASVRQVLTQTVDREALITKIFNDHARVVHGPLLLEIEGSNNTISATTTIEAASQLLEKNGWILGDDGVRKKQFGKNTVRLEFNLTVPQLQFLIETANLLKETWAHVGIKMNVIPVATDDLTDGNIRTRNYEMLLFGNILKHNPDIFAFWHSSERFFPGLNLALYENKKVDTLLESIRKNFTVETRTKDIKKLQELIMNDNPAIFLYSPNYLYITTNRLKGFDVQSIVTPGDRFDGITKWHFNTKRVFKEANSK